jgi:hypothetical protein
MDSRSDGFESFSLLAVDDDELNELDRILDQHPTILLHELVVDDPNGRLMDHYPSREPDPAVWDRIANEIRNGVATAPPDESPRSTVSPLRRRWVVAAGAVAAAAVVVAAVGGMLVGRDLTTQEIYAAEAAALAASPSSSVLTLNDPVAETAAASIVVGEDGRAFFVFDGLEQLEPGQTYQLWAVVDGEVISAALLGGGDGSTQPLRIEAEPEVLAVTIETTGGVVVSNESPVAVWAAEA